MLLKDEMKKALLKALNEINIDIDVEEKDIVVEHPPKMDMGDLACTLPLALARKMKCPPKMIGEKIAQAFHSPLFSEVSVASNGYLNVFIKKQFLVDNLKALIKNPCLHFSSQKGAGKKALIEFVSANPTGPITVANARGGPIGDTISNLIQWNGYEVCNEYYVNDQGSKIEKLAHSAWYYYQLHCGNHPEKPEEIYPGNYVQDLARSIREVHGDTLAHLSYADAQSIFKDFCLEKMLSQAKKDLESMNITFHSWFYEHKLHPDYLMQTLQRLTEKGCTYESEGALWLRTTAYGDDKDRVLVRKNGLPTYLAGDIAYHSHKFDRGFDLIVDVWGADQSHQKPLKWALETLGYDTGKWKIVVFQLVHLFRGREEVKMSKSSGDFITINELMEEVGPDVTRFLFLTRSNEQHLNFDMDLAKTRDLKNPVFYAQYAYTRCKGIMREVEKAGWSLEKNDVDQLQADSFSHEIEIMMLRKMATPHDNLYRASMDFTPHVVTQSILNLSADFHQFYEHCRILGIEDQKVAKSRLAIVYALERLFHTLFNILGISSPERM